jgi:hypothetical protein
MRGDARGRDKRLLLPLRGIAMTVQIIRLQATSNKQPATSNKQQATSNQQQTTSNKQPATCNRHQQPATEKL